jgi:hypothetical protein
MSGSVVVITADGDDLCVEFASPFVSGSPRVATSTSGLAAGLQSAHPRGQRSGAKGAAMLSNCRGIRPGRRWRTAVLAAVGTTVGMLAAGTTAAATTAPPTVSVITPGFGRLAGGTTVNVFGHNFTQVHSVTFAGVAGESLDVVSSTKLTVRAPAHSAGPVSVRVHAAAGTSPQVTTAVYHYTNKGAITGTVRAQSGLPGGRRLPNVDVVAFDQFGEYVTDTLTRINGDYLISGCPDRAAT